jgi:TP901 family phage tail tape measure protein
MPPTGNTIAELVIGLKVDDSGVAASLSRSISSFAGVGSTAKTAAGAVEDATSKMSAGAERAASTFLRLQQAAAMKQIGSAMQSVGAQFMGAIGGMVREAGNFEQNLNVFQATSHATAAQMQTVSQRAIDLGNDMKLPPTSAKTAIDGMLAMSRAGLGLNDVLGASRSALQLAAIGGMDAGKAAMFMANSLKVFHLEGTQANKVADMMAALTSAAGSKIEETARAVQYGGTAFAQAHVPMQDFMTEIGEMAQAGIKGSRAGSALGQMLTNLEAPSRQGAQVLKQLGVTIYDANGHMKNQQDIIAQLGPALNNLSQQDRDYAMKMLFSTNARRAANVVILGGVDAFDKMHEKVTAQGEADKKAAAAMAGYKGAVEQLNSQINTLQISMGQRLIPQVTSLVRWLSTLVDDFNKLSPGTQDFIVKGGLIAGVLLTVGGRIVSLLGTLAQLRIAWMTVGAAADAAAASETVAANAGAGAGARGLLGRLAGGAVGTLGAAGAVIGAGYYAATKGQETLFAGVDAQNKRDFAAGTARESADPAALRRRLAYDTSERKRIQSGIDYSNTSGYPASASELATMRAQVQNLTKDIVEVNKQLADMGKIGKTIAEQAVDHIKGPQGKATCAAFASEVLKAAGASIAGSASATALRNQLIAAGATEHPGAQARPGDYLYMGGPGYGTSKDARGYGYHAAIALGGGMMRQSSGGRVTTQHVPTHAPVFEAYSVPSALSEAGVAGGGSLQEQIAARTQAEREAAAEKKRLAKEVARDAEQAEKERLRANTEVTTEIFRLTHSEYETQVRQYRQDEAENIRSGVTKLNAHKLYLAQVAALDKQEAERKKSAAVSDPGVEGLRQERINLGELLATTTAGKLAWTTYGKALENLNPIHQKIITAWAQEKDAQTALTKAADDAQKKQEDAARKREVQLTHEHTLWQELNADYTKAQGALDVATGAEARHTAATESLALKYRDLGTWGRIWIGLIDQMKAKTDAATAAQKAAQALEAAQNREREQSQKTTDKIIEASADLHAEWTRVLHTGTDYESVLGRLNLASKTLTGSQQQMVQSLVKENQTLDTVRTLAEGTRSIVSGFFSDIIKGGKGFFSNMIQGFTNMFQEIAVKFLTNQAMQGLLGLFGGGRGVPGVAGPTNIGMSVASAFGGFFASGGAVSGGRPILVGERGPELFTPASNGSITANAQLAGAGGITINMTVYANDAGSFQRSSGQIMQDLYRQANLAQQRNR